MPNWCMNDLEIVGSPKLLNKLLKHVEITESEATSEHDKGDFSCHRIIPRPSNENDNWYNWNVANWGSKWDVSDFYWFENDWESGSLGATFSTAWSPIPQVILELSRQFPKLSFMYKFYESGNDFFGKVEYKKGVEYLIEEGSYGDMTCEQHMEYEGDSYHHYCNECYNEIECQGKDTQQLCEVCETSLEEQDKELWEEQDEQSERVQADYVLETSA